MLITSTNNKIITDFLQNKKNNPFFIVLDTPKIIKEAFEAGLIPQQLFIQKGKVFDFISNDILSKAIYVSENVLKKLTNVKTNAGLIAGFIYKSKHPNIKGCDFLVLDTVQDPGNVGTLLRSALGAGFKNVFLIDCAKITNEKTIRSAMGSIFKLNLNEISKQDFITFINQNKHLLVCADMTGENVFKTRFKHNIGLVLGNEGNGVSNEILALCTQKVSVPMLNSLESLNVAVSGSIIMYIIASRKES